MRGVYLLALTVTACRPEPHAAEQVDGPLLDVDIGTAQPFSLQRAANNGRWLVACQAREDTDGKPGISVRRTGHGSWLGDRMTPYLMRGAGAGTAIDSFVATSHDDRWIAVVRDHRLRLVDDLDGSDRELAGADIRGRHGDGQIAAFGAGVIVYARLTDNRSSIVIHSLATHTEREVAVDDTVWQIVPPEVEAQPWLEVRRVQPQWPHTESPYITESFVAGSWCKAIEGWSPDARGVHASWLSLATGSWLAVAPTRAVDVPQHPIDHVVVLDATGDHRLMALDPGDLSGRYHTFWITDTRTGVTTRLDGLDGAYAAGNDRYVAIDRVVLDVTQRRILGELPRPPIAVDNAGHALVPAVAATFDDAARGPVRWLSPRPR